MDYETFDRAAFAERLRETRKKRRLSQSALGELTGVHQNYICAWETGKGLPALENIVACADVLGVSVDRLVGRREDVKHRGKWRKNGNEYNCPNCERWFVIDYGKASMLYCPHCGEEKE